jgi:hypothetical protein
MAFSGDTFTKLYAWLTDPQRNEKIFNSRLDDEFGGVATGLSTVAASRARLVGGITPVENLIVKYVTAATIDIDADAVVLFDSGGASQRFESMNETLDITASGANGLDTGGEAADTWYHIWAIGKSDGTLDGLLSASSSAPTLPSGYTYKGYIGAARNNSSSNFISFLQIDSTVNIAVQVVLDDGSATSYTAVSLTAAIPPNAREVWLQPLIRSSSGTNAVTLNVASAGSGTTETYGRAISNASSVGTAREAFGSAFCPISTPQEVVYLVSGTNAQAYLRVYGWRF